MTDTSVTWATGGGSRAYDGLSETKHLGLAQQLSDGLLLVAHEGLLEEDPLFEPTLQAALDDLVQGGRGLALVLGDGDRGLAEVLDLLGGDVLSGEVLRTSKCDVKGDLVGEGLVTPETSTSTALTPRPFCRCR